MLRELSNEFAVNLKDRLRDVRYLIRSNRHDRSNAAVSTQVNQTLPTPEAMLSRAATVLDEALTTAETISLSFINSQDRKSDGPPPVQSLNVYFGNSAVGARAFRHDMYALLKAALARLGATNFIVHETAFLAIHTSFERKYFSLLTSLKKTGDEHQLAATAKAIAALFQEMKTKKPTWFQYDMADSECNTQYKYEQLAFAAVVLCVGLATAKQQEIEGVDYLEAVLLVLDARQDRLQNAIQDHGSESLESLFEMLLTHLP